MAATPVTQPVATSQPDETDVKTTELTVKTGASPVVEYARDDNEHDVKTSQAALREDLAQANTINFDEDVA